jgi:hypothetical protein
MIGNGSQENFEEYRCQLNCTEHWIELTRLRDFYARFRALRRCLGHIPKGGRLKLNGCSWIVQSSTRNHSIAESPFL